MALITRDTYNPEKNRAKVVIQKGKPGIDAEINEMQDILRGYLNNFYDLLFTGFSALGFQIQEHPTVKEQNFLIKLGRFYGKLPRLNSIDTSYVNQAVDYTFQTISPVMLTTPVSNRTDLVYLDVWREEVNSTTDVSQIDTSLGAETAVRDVIKFAVKVLEGSTTLPTPASGHEHHVLAHINRLAGNAQILASMIVDKRNIIASLDDTIKARRAYPFKVSSAKANLLNDNKAYGVSNMLLNGCEGDREYFITKISRNVGGAWIVEISDTVSLVARFSSTINPEGSEYFQVSPVGISNVRGFGRIKWSDIPNGATYTFAQGDLIILDQNCSTSTQNTGPGGAGSGNKVTTYRSGQAPLYVDPSDPTGRRCRVFRRDVQLVSADGSLQQHVEQEQENPVSRVDNKAEDISDVYILQNAMSELPANKILFTPNPDVLFSDRHQRVGFYVAVKGLGYTGIRITIHDDTNQVISTADVPIGSIPNGDWMYVDLPCILEYGRTYHYHFHTLNFTVGTSPRFGASSSGVIAFREMYKPFSGKFGSPDWEDVVVLFSEAGLLIPARVLGEDVGYASGPGVFDVMAVDFSDDAKWAAWEYNDYIGVDLLTGRVKFPPSLNPLNYGVNFNALENWEQADGKNTLMHGESRSVQEELVFLRNSLIVGAPYGFSAVVSGGTVAQPAEVVFQRTPTSEPYNQNLRWKAALSWTNTPIVGLLASVVYSKSFDGGTTYTEIGSDVYAYDGSGYLVSVSSSDKQRIT
jgi:hypothetical protein